ncbi:MAG: DPP IV N-terminal domain-containing protein, partial [Myxococcota bacterium]
MKVWTAAALILIAGCAAANPTPLATKTTAVPPSEKGGQEPISLDEIFSGALVGTPPSSPRWSPDGGHLAFAWTAPGEAQRHLWLASPQQPKPIKVGLPSSVSSFDWRADSSGVVCLAGAELWSVSKEGEATRLADVGPGASTLSLAPGGSLGAFLKEGDLWLVDLDRAAVRAATKVGIPPISPLTIGRYNRREREIGPGIWGGPTYAWSPDGRFVAMHHVDRRKMRKVPFPDYLGKETRPNLVRRGYPGDPNEERTVVLLEAATGKLRTLSFAAPAQTQIIGFAWSPSGELLVDRASDTAVDRWLHTVDPSTGDATEIWHGRRESRIYTRFASTWHPDGRRVIFSSDLEERYGLYLLDPSRPQSEPQRLSDPSHDVLSAPR